MIEMPLYLFHFAQIHNDFRLPELASVSELFSIPYKLSDVEEGRDPSRPFMVIELESDDHARTLARRCILIKYGLPKVFCPSVKSLTVIQELYTSFTHGDQATRLSMLQICRTNHCGSDTLTIPLSASLSLHISTKFRLQGRGTLSIASLTWASWGKLT